tara:strand:- start:314 stop:1042 length:729 start_codon:yes stop_codon:yes gene_type:complete
MNTIEMNTETKTKTEMNIEEYDNKGSNHSDSDSDTGNEMNNDYIFNKLPHEELKKLILLSNDITDIIKNNKNIIKNKSEFEQIDVAVRNIEKEYINMTNTIRKAYINTYSENKRTYIENKKMKKKLKNKENFHVNKKKVANDFTLVFMNLDKTDNMVSSADILRSFSSFIKEEKNKNNKDIFVYKENNEIDNKQFRITGKLKDLFDNVQKEISDRGDTLIIPETLSYNNIFTYIKYLFKLAL